MAKLNWSTSNSQITDELINVSSSGAFGLQHDAFYNKAGKLLEIWTGSGGTGTQLTESTDYTIGGAIADASLPSSISPDVAYSTLAITNAAYHSTDLYVSYYPLGDYIEAEDFSQLVTGIRLATKDISASNQTTDLSIYEPGGSSVLQDGAKVHVSWSGGDGTYCHKFTVTSGWKIKSNFVDLAPGDNSAAFAWCGYGTGGLTLVKDEANSRWIVETEGCFDRVDGLEKLKIFTDKTAQSIINVLMNCSSGTDSSYTHTYLLPHAKLLGITSSGTIRSTDTSSASQLIDIDSAGVTGPIGFGDNVYWSNYTGSGIAVRIAYSSATSPRKIATLKTEYEWAD